MCAGGAQDTQDDAVRVMASGRKFFFGDAGLCGGVESTEGSWKVLEEVILQ